MADRIYWLSKSEHQLLKRLASENIVEGYLDETAKKLGIEKTTLASLLMLLSNKGLVTVEEEIEPSAYLTDKGQKALSEGLPEEKLIKLLIENEGRIGINIVKSKLGREAGIAIGQAKKKGFVEIKDNTVVLVRDPDEALRGLSRVREALLKVMENPRESAPEELMRRGLVKIRKIKKQRFKLRAPPIEILEKSTVVVSKLSSNLISTGLWRKAELRRYDVTAEPPRIYPARKHFLVEFIEMLRDIMKELGFIEVRGPIVEMELFNFDLLFQAQDHPAREIHDTLWIKKPRRADLTEYKELVERVARIHEEGWGYKWDPEIAARLLLRSQTTSVSARVLSKRPQPPIRYFTIGRVYRSDVVDATHLPEFHQLDGIMGWPGYTFKDLIGILREVAGRLGLKLKLKPGYFPFTEPSVEGYVRLPSGKWLELFGAGLFRPEVLEMAGVDYPVGAWGFGVERFAAATLGVTDIRDLYTRDLEKIFNFKVKLV